MVTVEIPSDYKYLNLVDKITTEVTSICGFEVKSIDEIAISIIEACTNAIEHGNKCCPEKVVKIVYRVLSDRIYVDVYDSGEGFDYEKYLNEIHDPQDITHYRGRGLYIMKNMMDELEFEKLPDSGMKVTLGKYKR